MPHVLCVLCVPIVCTLGSGVPSGVCGGAVPALMPIVTSLHCPLEGCDVGLLLLKEVVAQPHAATEGVLQHLAPVVLEPGLG